MDSVIVDVTSTLGYQSAVAAGTGIILSSSGAVLTNNHVVSGATSVQVNISTDDARKFDATVVGTDSTNDIALLQVQDLSGFKAAVLGDSSKVTVGQPVVAIGNALAIPGPPKVTEGQVTAVGRSITASDGHYGEQLQNLFQIDAELSPGNSGGPLFDTYGRVIGINTAAGSNGFQSSSTVGFAIPINDAKAIVTQIESGQSSGTVRVGPPAFLGVQLSDRGIGREFGRSGRGGRPGCRGHDPGPRRAIGDDIGRPGPGDRRAQAGGPGLGHLGGPLRGPAYRDREAQ
jgi:S1-C subfamily serine protease